MAKKKSPPPKKRLSKKPPTKKKPSVKSLPNQLTRQVKQTWLSKVTHPRRNFLSRRPHRSFRRTRRRDYVRNLKIAGYWSFSLEVTSTLWKQKKLFGLMILFYVLISATLIGVGSQDTYNQISELIKTSGQDIFAGAWGEVGKAGLLLFAGVSGSFSPQLTESQQIYSTFVALLTWLTTIWLLRVILAGKQPRLRDGLYNAGAPIVSTALIGLMLLIQLLPLALAVIGYTAAAATGFLDSSLMAMVFWLVAALLAMLSIYWLTSTIFALVIVTLPGMYPYQAVRTAGDLVIGRRIRVLLRLVWMMILVVLFWMIVVIPIIIVDAWLKSVLPSISWVPIVPFVVLVVTTTGTVWAASYLYLFYRKVVADDSAPA